MKPVVYSRSESFRQFLQGHLQIPLDFHTRLEAPGRDAGGVCLLHVSSLDGEQCQGWLQQYAADGTIPVAACSNLPGVAEMLTLVRHGIRAYCNSHMAALHYRQMLDMLSTGQSWFPPELLAQTFELAQKAAEPQQPATSLAALTARENEIAGYVGEGMSNREIAQQLGISEPTVKSHLTQIFKKLDLNDRVGLVLHLQRA